MNSRISAVVATVALAALSMAAFDGITFKKTPKVGDVHKYKQTGKFDVQGQSIEFEAVAIEKVVKVETTGNYSIEESQSDVKINGAESPAGAGGATTTTYTAKGEIVELKGDAIQQASYRLANMALFIMPDKDLKAGDTWSYDIKADSKNDVPAGKATYTFVGEDKVGSVDAYKVKFSIKEAGNDPASSDGTEWIGKADGLLLKMTTKWDNVPVPGVPVAITGDISLTLLP